ncbi:hypothetical protein D3C84_1089720 [compost metagenome]
MSCSIHTGEVAVWIKPLLDVLQLSLSPVRMPVGVPASAFGQHVTNFTVSQRGLTETTIRMTNADDIAKMLELVGDKGKAHVGSVELICKGVAHHIRVESQLRKLLRRKHLLEKFVEC